MRRPTARWTTTLATATLLALPASGSAQTEPPAQPPATAQAPTQTEQPAAPQPGVDQEAAKAHLTAARHALSQITQLPAAAQLTGDTRTQVSQLIKNFNELITTQSNWRVAYAKVEANLNALLSAPSTEEPARPSGTPGAVGTSGTMSTLDPAIRAKLMEFRGHLDKFEAVVGGGSPPEAASASATPAMTQPPAAATTSTTTSTTTTTSAQPPAAPAPSAPPSDQPVTVNPREVLRHVEAIEVILGAQAAAQTAAQAAAGGAVGTASTPSGSTRITVTSADVTLNQAQLTQLRTHLAELRRLIEKK